MKRPRFLKPPDNPGRSDFPSPVLDPGLLQQVPSRRHSGLSPDRHTPTAPAVYTHPNLHGYIPRYHLNVCGVTPMGVTRCPEPLRPVPRGEYLLHLGGHYSPIIATTGSCASPDSSARLRVSPSATGLRGSLSVPASTGTFPSLSPNVFPQMPEPVPRWPSRCA